MFKRMLPILGLSALLAVPGLSQAQTMMGGWTATSASSADVTQTSQEETQGKAVWDQLRAKQTNCGALTDDEFGHLGEYFMGQMMGTTVHANMNAAMKAQLGEAGETQLHVALGKRLSSCDTSADFPANSQGFATMFSMMNGGSMMGNFSGSNGYGWGSMMGNWGTTGSVLDWLWMVLVWALVIVAIVALWRWATRAAGQAPGTALEVLKTRYAKGEIDAEEFAEKKKVLVEV